VILEHEQNCPYFYSSEFQSHPVKQISTDFKAINKAFNVHLGRKNQRSLKDFP